MATSSQAHFILYGSLRGKARYKRGHNAQYSGFKLATCTFVLFILEFFFIATSHEHLRFYHCFGNNNDFYAINSFAHKLIWFPGESEGGRKRFPVSLLQISAV